MKRLRHPATVIAALALFVALGGGAAAYASGLISGSQIKNHSIAENKLTKKAIKALRGQRGPQGPAGQTGQTGPTGLQGPIGPSSATSTYESSAGGIQLGNVPWATTVLSLALPAGSYIVTAHTTIGDSSEAEITECRLHDSVAGALDEGQASTATTTPATSLSLLAPLTSSGSTVSIQCDTNVGTPNALARFVHLAAIKLGSVSGT